MAANAPVSAFRFARCQSHLCTVRRELFAFWKAPCSDPTIVGAGASTFIGWVCNDFFGAISE